MVGAVCYKRGVLPKGQKSPNRRRGCRGSFLGSILAGLSFLPYCPIVATAQSTAPAPQNRSADPQISKSEQAKRQEAERAAARARAHHFDRVLIIVLENVDYERATQDPSLRDLAIEGASLTNFHALFHPSYPNYLAMIAGTDFGLHRRGSLLGDLQVNLPSDSAHRTIADRLIAAGLDFKQYGEELPPGTCPWNISARHIADKRGNHVRRHVPFLSFREVQERWCGHGDCRRLGEG